LRRKLKLNEWLASVHFFRFPIWLFWFFSVVQEAAEYGMAFWFLGHPLYVLPGLYADAIVGHLLLRRYHVASAISVCENTILALAGVLAYPATRTLGPGIPWTEIMYLQDSLYAWFGLSVLGVVLVILAAVQRFENPQRARRNLVDPSGYVGHSCMPSLQQWLRDPRPLRFASSTPRRLLLRRCPVHSSPVCR
jgi:hypothetical protein